MQLLSVRETGSELMNEIYEKALGGNVLLSFSAWNIGEVLYVLDKYCRRRWLHDENYLKARRFEASSTHIYSKDPSYSVQST